MATWHQEQYPVKLFHENLWTVVIDQPNKMRALMCFKTKALCEVYMRGLKECNPSAHKHAYILRPVK